MIDHIITNTTGLTIKIVSIAIFISSFEYIYLLYRLKQYSFVSQETISLSSKLYSNNRLKFIFKDSVFVVLQAIKILSTVVLFVLPPHGALWSLVLVVLFITCLLSNYRDSIGREGSDQMQLIILMALFLTSQFWSSELLRLIGLIFIAIQSSISYSVAGISKLFSKYWRNGSAFFSIMNTVSYGDQRLAKLYHRRKYLGLITCWIVIVFECLFPLVFFLPERFMFVFLGTALIFHLANAFIMGLNNFTWTFLATYPSIVLTNHLLMN